MKKGIFLLFSIFSIMMVSCGGSETSSSSYDIESSLFISENSEESISISSEDDTTFINALSKIKNSYRIDGEYVINGYTHTFINISTSDSYYFAEYYYNNLYKEVVTPYVEGSFVYEDGEVYLLETALDNTIKRTKQDVPWSTFENPFHLLEIEDFIKTDDTYYSLNNERALALGNALTGWSHESVVSSSFEINDEDIVSIKMTLSTIYDGDIEYVMNVSKTGCANKKNMIYETKDYHHSLRNAFDSFDSTNYKAIVSDKAYSEKDKEFDVEYEFYRIEGMYFDSYSSTGLVKLEEGTYEYEVVDLNASLKEESKEELLSYTPRFDFAPELFTKVNETTYVLEADFLIGDILSMLGLDYNMSLLGSYYGMDLFIYVENDEIKGFSFNYNVQDLYSKMEITFSNIGSTSMPFDYDFSSSSEDIGGSEIVIPASYIGTYVGSLSVGDFNGETEITVEITSSSISINGIEASIVEFSVYEGFTIIINGVEYYLMDASYEEPVSEVMLMTSDYSMYGFMLR